MIERNLTENFFAEECCECNKKFKDNSSSGFKTGTRPYYTSDPNGRQERYVIGKLCEGCMK